MTTAVRGHMETPIRRMPAQIGGHGTSRTLIIEIEDFAAGWGHGRPRGSGAMSGETVRTLPSAKATWRPPGLVELRRRGLHSDRRGRF